MGEGNVEMNMLYHHLPLVINPKSTANGKVMMTTMQTRDSGVSIWISRRTQICAQSHIVVVCSCVMRKPTPAVGCNGKKENKTYGKNWNTKSIFPLEGIYLCGTKLFANE